MSMKKLTLFLHYGMSFVMTLPPWGGSEVLYDHSLHEGEGVGRLRRALVLRCKLFYRTKQKAPNRRSEEDHTVAPWGGGILGAATSINPTLEGPYPTAPECPLSYLCSLSILLVKSTNPSYDHFLCLAVAFLFAVVVGEGGHQRG